MITEAIESWIDRGRRKEVRSSNGTSTLRYGPRFRTAFALVFCAMSCGLIAGLLGTGFATERLFSHWMILIVLGTFALFAATYLAYTLTCRVEIREDSVSVYSFGFTNSVCHSVQIVTAYKSRVHDSLVLVSSHGKKTRVSTRLDGLKALVQWLSLRPESVLTESVLDWMHAESPEFGEQWDVRASCN